MTARQGHFDLERRHIETGIITEQEMSAYAGIPVTCRTVTHYPYGGELLQGTLLKDEQKVLERCAAFYEDQKEIRKWPKGSFEKLQKKALSSGAANSLLLEIKKGALSAENQAWIDMRPWLVAPKESAADRAAGDVEGIVPYHGLPQNRQAWLIKGDPLSQVYEYANSALILLRPENNLALQNLARDLNVTKDKIAFIPKAGNAAKLRLLLHEMRHAVHVVPVGRKEDTQFLEELDAEYFAFTTLRKANFGADDLVTTLNMRMLRLLIAQERAYYIAPALEALMNGQQPPSFQAICESVRQIKKAIVLRASSSADDFAFGKPAFQDRMIRMDYSINPADVFVPLRSLAEEKAFSANPLTQRMAERIVVAARFFNPAWIGDPDRKKNIRPATSLSFPCG